MVIAVISPSVPDWSADVACRVEAGGGSFKLFTASDAATGVERLLHRLAACVADTYGHHSSAATRRLADKIEMLMPDVVHLTALETDFFNYPMLLDRLTSLPVEIVVSVTDRCPGWRLFNRRKYNAHIIDRILKTLPRITVAREFSTARDAMELYTKLTESYD